MTDSNRDEGGAEVGTSEPPASAAGDEPIPGSAGYLESQVPPRLPRPGLALAVGLAVLTLLTQILVGIPFGIVIAVAHLSKAPPVAELADRIVDVAYLPASTFTTVVLSFAVAFGLYRRDLWRCIGWRGCSAWQIAAVALFLLPLAVVANELTNVIGAGLSWLHPEWFAKLHEEQVRIFTRFAAQPWWLVLLGGSIFPGLGEEVLCRGVMSRGLLARYGVLGGTLLASTLFGAMHLEPVHVFGALVLGIGLQHTFLTTRSLAAPILVHIGNNALAFVMLRWSDRYSVQGMSSIAGGEHLPIPVFVSAVAALSVASWLLFRLRTRWFTLDGQEWSPGYVSVEAPPQDVVAIPTVARPPLKTFAATVFLVGLMLALIAILALEIK